MVRPTRFKHWHERAVCDYLHVPTTFIPTRENASVQDGKNPDMKSDGWESNCKAFGATSAVQIMQCSVRCQALKNVKPTTYTRRRPILRHYTGIFLKWLFQYTNDAASTTYSNLQEIINNKTPCCPHTVVNGVSYCSFIYFTTKYLARRP